MQERGFFHPLPDLPAFFDGDDTIYPKSEYPLSEAELCHEINRLEQGPLLESIRTRTILERMWHADTLALHYQEIVPSILDRYSDCFTRETELGMTDSIREGLFRGDGHGVTVEWNARAEIRRGVGGAYYPNEPKIAVASQSSNEFSILYSLATTGSLPWSIKTYGHELTHHHQYYYVDDETGEWEMHQNPMDTELIEAQAYLVSDFDSPNEVLVNRILTARDRKGELLYPGVDETKLASALRDLRILNYYHIPQQIIAVFVRNPGAWNDEAKVYENIDEIVNIALSGNGTSLEEVERRSALTHTYQTLSIRNAVNEKLLESGGWYVQG